MGVVDEVALKLIWHSCEGTLEKKAGKQWLNDPQRFTLTKRWWCIPLEKPIWMEPAGGIAWAYQAETTVTVELKSATWTELGSVDHAPIQWGVINATVGSLIDRDTKTNKGERFNKKGRRKKLPVHSNSFSLLKILGRIDNKRLAPWIFSGIRWVW